MATKAKNTQVGYQFTQTGRTVSTTENIFDTPASLKKYMDFMRTTEKQLVKFNMSYRKLIVEGATFTNGKAQVVKEQILGHIDYLVAEVKVANLR